MNRIESLLQQTHVPASMAAAQVESALYRREHRRRLALFMPLHYEANYAYPLLVWLHGPGDDENQLKRIMPLVSMRNYVGVAPRGTVTGGADGVSPSGVSWCQSQQHILLAEQRVFEAIDTARRKTNIAQERVFLAGFGTGGTMAYRVAMNHPDRFAGVLSLDGPFPSGGAPLRNLPAARQVPVFVACGRSSRTYAPERVCDDLRLFHIAGLSLALRVYPCGHEITSEMLGDVDRWIMEMIASPAPK